MSSMTSKSIFSMLDLDDYVFVMDEKNLYDLKFKFRAENVFLLSVAAGKKGPILDPYLMFNADKYHDAFTQIETIDKIGATMKNLFLVAPTIRQGGGAARVVSIY